jgi:GDP-L-fucose synthase
MIRTLKNLKVWVAGHRGMIGSALLRRLENEGCELLTIDRTKLDLTRQNEVEKWFGLVRPEVVFMAAARVGGIYSNANFPAEFIYENLSIQTNIIEAARKFNIKKLIFFGSACTYPKTAPQPVNEDQLLAGYIEPTNQWYAVAKIAGLKMIEAYRKQYGCDFISLMPANSYGIGDNFDLTAGHVIPAMIRKFHEAKLKGDLSVELWGTGVPLREFLFADDLADAAVFLSKNYSESGIINIGTGDEISISDLANQVALVVNYKGTLIFNNNYPDGAYRKVLNSNRLNQLGWRHSTTINDGISATYKWFLENELKLRK